MGSLGRLATTLLGAIFIHPHGLGIMVGSLVGSLLFPSRREQGPATFANLQVTTSQRGEPIPIVYGTQRIAGNLIWYGNFQRHEQGQGGKGGGKGGSPPDPEVRYSASFAVGVCEGPISDIPRIWAGKDPIDMGLEGTRFTIYTGTSSQTADPHITSVFSSGNFGAGGGSIGGGTYRENITPPASGAIGAYTALTPPVASGTALLFYTSAVGGIGGSTGRVGYAFVTTTPGADQVWMTNHSAGTLMLGWPASSPAGNLTFEYTQTSIGSVTPLAYRHTAYVVFTNWDLGASATIPNFTFEVSRNVIGGNFADNFNRTDANSLGSNWDTEIAGTDPFAMEVASSQLQMPGLPADASKGIAVYADAVPPDQYAEMRFVGWPGTPDPTGGGPAIRMNGTSSNFTGYVARYAPTASPSLLRVMKWVGQDLYWNLGSGASLAGAVGTVLSSGDLVRLSAVGSLLSCYVNGTLVMSLNDASIAAGGVGIVRDSFGFGGPTGTMYWDNWAGGGFQVSDANPVDVLSDFIANDRYGAGMTIVQDTDSWRAVRTYCESFDILVSPIIADRRRAIDQIEHVLSYFDGMMPYSQGIFKLKARRAESPTTSLSPSDYAADKGPSFGRMAQRETRNRLRLEYANRADDYNRGVVEAWDDWSAQETGERQESITLPGVTRSTLAQRWIQRALWSRLHQPIMGTLPLGPNRTLLEAGDVVSITHSEVGLENVRARVRSISESPNQTFAVDVVEEPTEILGWPTFPPPDIGLTNPGPDHTDWGGDTIAGVFELPAELPSPWSDVPVLGIAATGVRSTWARADIYVSRDDVTYTRVGPIPGRATLGFLTTVLPDVPMMGLYDNERGEAAVDLSVSFGSLTTIGREEMLGATRVAYTNGEFLSFQTVTVNSTHRYSLRGMLRGLFDSDVGSKANGTLFYLIGTPWLNLNQSNVQLVPLTRDDIGKPIYLKMPSVGLYGAVQDITSVQAINITPRGTRLQPDPVSLLQEDNLRGLDITDQLSITMIWRYRQQGNVEDVEFNSGTILGRAADFSTFVGRIYTSASSAGAWTANTVTETLSETLTFVGSLGQYHKFDVSIRDTQGDESPAKSRVIRVLP